LRGPSGAPGGTIRYLRARQLRASEHLAGAVSSGSERVHFRLPLQISLNHAGSLAIPKLRVAGSIPVVRLENFPLGRIVGG
jgi:hypothetical protein